MFYSHEVLTSRKYGLATVWLVATMGSGMKKVSRKAILDVDVTKTCETIAAPSMPLALRLQSSLLYGVTRVYAQQCGFVLHDVENARNHMRVVLKTVHTTGLKAEGMNKEGAEHLVLGDDPSFLLDFDLALPDLALSFEDEQYSHLATTASMATSNSQRASDRSVLMQLGDDLRLSSLRGPSGVRLSDMLTYQADLGDGTPRPRMQDVDATVQAQYHGLQEDLGLMTGDDGNAIMQEFVASQNRVRTVSTQPAAQIQADVFHDDDLVGYDDEHMQLTDERHPLASPRDHLHDAAAEGAMYDSAVDEVVIIPETARAAIRPQKSKKIVSLDPDIELSRRALKSQQEDYLENMQHATVHKQKLLSLMSAKTNAAHWMYSNHDNANDSLAMFSGVQLLCTVAKTDFGDTHRPARDNSTHPERTRRAQSHDRLADEIAPDFQDHGFMPDYDEIEQGREQPTPLNDTNQSSLLPWNRSISSHRPTSSRAAMSIGLEELPRFSSIHQRRRMGTASPLAIRATQASLDRLSDTPGVRYGIGEAATADDQVDELATQNESQWLRHALHDESMNFLSFVRDAVEHRHGTSTGEVPDSAISSIDFDELLSASKHSYLVAAQAFLHLLVLGTKRLLTAEQELPFGSIAITLL